MREEVKRLAEEKDKMFIDNHSKEMELKREKSNLQKEKEIIESERAKYKKQVEEIEAARKQEKIERKEIEENLNMKAGEVGKLRESMKKFLEEKSMLQAQNNALKEKLGMLVSEDEKDIHKRSLSINTSEEEQKKKRRVEIVGDYQWTPIIGELPEIGETVWVSRNNEPAEVKINKRIRDNVFKGQVLINKEMVEFTFGSDNSHIWSYERPVRLKTPDNSDIGKAPQSMPQNPIPLAKIMNPLGKRKSSEKK